MILRSLETLRAPDCDLAPHGLAAWHMKVTTIFYFISGVGFALIGSSIVPVSGVSSAIIGGAFLIWAGYREYKNLKKQVNAWK